MNPLAPALYSKGVDDSGIILNVLREKYFLH